LSVLSERVERLSAVVGIAEVRQVLAQLSMIVAAATFDRGLLDGAIHSLDRPISPVVFDFGQAMLDRMFDTNPPKEVIDDVPVADSVRELNAVAGQHRMDGVQHCIDQVARELCGNHLAGFGVEFGQGELGGPVNRHKEIKRACGRLHLGNVEVKITDQIALESLLCRFVTRELEPPRDSVALETSVARTIVSVAGWSAAACACEKQQ